MTKKYMKYIYYILMVLLLSFFLPRLIPGSPAYALAEDIDSIRSFTTDAVSAFQDYYAPELPLWQQFLKYIKNIIRLDFGYSFYFKMPVMALIKGRLFWTMLLSLTSIVISTIIAVIIGINAGLKEKSGKTFGLLLILQAVPVFLIAAFMQILFAYRMGMFPPTGAYSPGNVPGNKGYIPDVLAHMVLPLTVLVISEVPSMAIFARNSTLKIKKEHYVAMARFLGIQQSKIHFHYIFKNILPELLGKLSIQFTTAISGAIFVEAVFSYPGLGLLLRNAVSYRDYPLLQGILLICCAYGLIVNLLFEMIAAKLTQNYEYRSIK